MDLYAENILDHYRHPRSHGALSNPTVARQEINPSCGDEILLHLTVKDGRIEEVGWTGAGCAISQAGMSMLSEELPGKTLSEAAALTGKTMQELLGVPIGARRLKCAMLALHTLKNALHLAQGEPTQDWNATLV